jgi:N-acetyl-gamma-glutamylphosphate reductase
VSRSRRRHSLRRRGVIPRASCSRHCRCSKPGLIKPHGIIADSHSGVSGAGRKAEIDYLFCECNESVRPYGVPKHRHLSEIEEQMSFAAGEKVVIQFTPHLMPVNRGILTTLYLAPSEHFSDAAGAAKVGEQIAACYAKPTRTNPLFACWKAKRCPTPRMSWARTSAKLRGDSIRARAGSS